MLFAGHCIRVSSFKQGFHSSINFLLKWKYNLCIGNADYWVIIPCSTYANIRLGLEVGVGLEIRLGLGVGYKGVGNCRYNS